MFIQINFFAFSTCKCFKFRSRIFWISILAPSVADLDMLITLILVTAHIDTVGTIVWSNCDMSRHQTKADE